MAGSWSLAWRLARRELRGGFKGLGVFLACLALGVAAIAAVGVVNAGVLGLASGGTGGWPLGVVRPADTANGRGSLRRCSCCWSL